MKVNASKFSEVVAVSYTPKEDNAPKVIAKGKGYVADKILDIAHKNNIPVKEDPELLQVLSALDLEQEIPPHVYKVMAELLAFVYSVNKKYMER